MESKRIWVHLLVAASLALQTMSFDYAEALAKSIMFYEGQRSGRLPQGQRATWRSDSGLEDGKAQGVDLVGGYYDAGDNVKFGLPMAFTVTMLSWSTMEYGSQIEASGQIHYALDAIRWGTDYLLKAHPEPNVLWGQVGDGFSDHECWQRPEDMTTPRQAYKIDAGNPGSDLAGETAAALAAASITFRSSDPSYSDLLIVHAKQLFEFADKYRGKYDSSIRAAQNFYTSRSGYADELLWASFWLFEATSEEYFLEYAANNAASLGGTSWGMTEFSWDVKYPGLQVLASKILLEGRGGKYAQTLELYKKKAEYYLCAAMQKNNGPQVQRTPGGLMYVRSWNNMQYVVTASYLLTVYSDYLANSRQQLQCARGTVDSTELFGLAKSQVDYILGDNPRATSYLVGFGRNYPRQVHHRASSIVSIKVDGSFVSCRGGYAAWFARKTDDPNVLVGALVGGPDQNDNFADERYNYEQTEPTSYNNGPLIGVLARLQNAPSYRKRHVKKKHELPSSTPPLVQASDLQINQPEISDESQVVTITQKLVGSWWYQGKMQYKYEVSVKNTSSKILSSLLLKLTNLQGQCWGLTKATGENSYAFPHWLNSLNPAQDFMFVYINAAPQLAISLTASTFL